jgi:hypothetical protein
LRKGFIKSEKFDLKKANIKALMAEKNRTYRKGGKLKIHIMKANQMKKMNLIFF